MNKLLIHYYILNFIMKIILIRGYRISWGCSFKKQTLIVSTESTSSCSSTQIAFQNNGFMGDLGWQNLRRLTGDYLNY